MEHENSFEETAMKTLTFVTIRNDAEVQKQPMPDISPAMSKPNSGHLSVAKHSQDVSNV